jgi:chromosome segregation ATPase
MIKKLILTIAAGLISFGAMFAVAWLTAKTPSATKAQEPADKSTSAPKLPSPPVLAGKADEEAEKQMRRAMTEKQLESLVYEVRERIQEYDEKLAGLNSREQRLGVAHNELKKDIEDLNDLRVELASTIAILKEERSKLDNARIEIEKTEQTNLMSIAVTYDKMDPASASTILTNIAKAQTGSPNDAIKILHYMSDRTKANLLAELANAEPALAAYFCQKLKQIVEKK